MALFDEWKKIAYNEKQDQAAIRRFWDDYFLKEKGVYEKLLETPEEKVSGTVKELAEKYNLTVLEMTGFLDGINDSLVEKNPVEEVEEDTVVSLDFDNERLYKNMVAADAEWLYNLPQWEPIFDKDRRHALYLEEKKSHTIRVGKKIGRNEPCPCGSGKKYKFCHGKKGAPPLPEADSDGAAPDDGKKK